jgi:hypothetical protein
VHDSLELTGYGRNAEESVTAVDSLRGMISLE